MDSYDEGLFEGKDEETDGTVDAATLGSVLDSAEGLLVTLFTYRDNDGAVEGMDVVEFVHAIAPPTTLPFPSCKRD